MVNVEVLPATGTAEKEAALSMIEAIPGNHRVTVGADNAYDTKAFVEESRKRNAQNNKGRRSPIDGRSTRHAGYTESHKKRMRVEEIFGWIKAVDGMRQLRHRGLELVKWMFTMTAAVYNVVHVRNLATAVVGASA